MASKDIPVVHEVADEAEIKSTPTAGAGKRKSRLWETDFQLLPQLSSDGKPVGKCRKCGWTANAVGSQGTSNFSRHKKNCDKKHVKSHDVSQMIMDTEGKIISRKIDQEVFKEKLANLTFHHEYSFSFVEHKKFRELLTYLNPDVKHITRNTLKAKVLNVNGRERKIVAETLQNCPGRICLTSDMWTSNASQSYICLTAHFIDENWVLRSFVLNLRHFPPSHTAAAMNTCLLNLLREWGIQHKIYSITLDNASSCNKLQDLLRASLSHEHPLPANGEYFHVRCGAHILNLIVQDGLKLIDEAVVKLRKATNWVDASEGRILAFVDCAKRAGCLVKKGLSRDSLTRWNSTWDMIDRALIYKPAFLLLGEEDKNFTHKLTESEWFRTERIWKLLKPFSHITEVFSGSKYPTANLYFSHVYDIELTLRQEMRSDDECIKTMATAMKEKFDKYWANYSMVLCFAVVLDPYLKLDYIKFSYEELYPTDHEQKVAEVVSAIEKLFETYSVDQADENVGASIRTSNVTHPTSRDAAFDLYEPSRLSSSKSELQLYMADLRLIRPPKYDVLAWWKANEGRYPCLSKMARDVMAIPITTVASESTFSLGGRILTKFRQSTLPENAEAIVQTRSWLNSAENLKDEVQLKVAESTIDFNAFLDGNQNKTV